jgi:hypothetical protein
MGTPLPAYLVVDIETVPDTELWTAPETPLGTERPFPPAYAHRAIVIGCLLLDGGYRLHRLGVVGDKRPLDDERGILEDFSAYVRRTRPQLVTYNGRTFDLPVLAYRSLHHGVPMPWYYDRGVRYRYSEEGHIDLCDVLADHGATRPVSLDALARLIGLPGKLGVDGSQIEGLYNAGQGEIIQNYCLADVAQTALLFLRFRLLQGALSPEAYRAAASALMEQLRVDARLRALVDAIDGNRLLMAA